MSDDDREPPPVTFTRIDGLEAPAEHTPLLNDLEWLAELLELSGAMADFRDVERWRELAVQKCKKLQADSLELDRFKTQSML